MDAFLLLLLGAFGSIALYWLGDTVRLWAVNRIASRIVEQPETDHAVCQGDHCGQVLCYCNDVPKACPGTVDPGCLHVGAEVCEDHRLSDCRGCLEDYAEDRSLQLAEDMWRGLL